MNALPTGDEADIPFPDPVNYPGNVTNGTIPRRFTYPQDEVSTNTANYNAAVARLPAGIK